MDDNRELVEEVWFELIKIYQQTNGQKALDDGIAYLFAYGEARYKAGVEAMRDAVRGEMFGYDLDALAACLLETKQLSLMERVG